MQSNSERMQPQIQIRTLLMSLKSAESLLLNASSKKCKTRGVRKTKSTLSPHRYRIKVVNLPQKVRLGSQSGNTTMTRKFNSSTITVVQSAVNSTKMIKNHLSHTSRLLFLSNKAIRKEVADHDFAVTSIRKVNAHLSLTYPRPHSIIISQIT